VEEFEVATSGGVWVAIGAFQFQEIAMQVMFRCLRVVCVACVSLTTHNAFAQTTLGELQDAGGKQMSKDEVVAAVSGNTIVGTGVNGAINRVAYKSDGTYSGSGSSGGNNYGFFGTWSVEADGQGCSVLGNGQNRGTKVCGYWFKASDQYFVSPSNSDRTAAVFKRTRQ
jgi:hypothetical protein